METKVITVHGPILREVGELRVELRIRLRCEIAMSADTFLRIALIRRSSSSLKFERCTKI